MKTIKHKGNILTIEKLSYENGRVALQLVNADGEPYAMATVNIPEEELKPDEVMIKNWSENEGILESLIDAEIVSKSLKKVPTGFVSAHVCKLLI